MSDSSRFPLPVDLPIALDAGTSLWSGGRVATGGVPWKVVRLADAARPHLAALRRAPGGLADPSPVGRALARLLLDHGLARPVLEPRPGPHDVTVVIPAYGRTDELERSLAAVAGLPVIVVDDASPEPGPLRRAAEAHGARLVRQPVNRGPAAARNTGLRLAETPLVAFVDSDCRPVDGWLDVVVPHFDDPRVAAVAPRVRPDRGGDRLLARYEAARSALDMGRRPALVRPGGRLGFVPTATLLVRVAAVEGDAAFDEELRLGEDVDFVWRLGDRGWNVRYEPAAQVVHTARLRPSAWARRRHEYGTSAADLARRHPGRLAPARPSLWNLAVLGLLARGRPGLAAACAAAAAALLARRLARLPADWSLAAAIVGKGIVADAAALGHALRREWWPAGLLVLAASPRSRTARAAALAMLAPIALEWLRERPRVDPVRYTALRLAEDVAYGSGVTAASVRARSSAPLRPDVRLPEGLSSARLRKWTRATVERFRRVSG